MLIASIMTAACSNSFFRFFPMTIPGGRPCPGFGPRAPPICVSLLENDNNPSFAAQRTPNDDQSDASRRFAKTLTRFLGHGRRYISGGDMAGVADSGEGRFVPSPASACSRAARPAPSIQRADPVVGRAAWWWYQWA
jgi:hypothetical protein